MRLNNFGPKVFQRFADPAGRNGVEVVDGVPRQLEQPWALLGGERPVNVRQAYALDANAVDLLYRYVCSGVEGDHHDLVAVRDESLGNPLCAKLGTADLLGMVERTDDRNPHDCGSGLYWGC